MAGVVCAAEYAPRLQRCKIHDGRVDFSMITFRIGFSYVFGVHMGWMAVGVWAAMVIDWVFRVLCFVGRYLAGTWRKKCGLVAPTA